MKTIFAILTVPVLVLGLGLVTATPVGADNNGPVHNVTKDTYHGTIQEAIDDADDDDTIMVAAGTYAENVVIDKSLTLEGAQAGVDARNRTGPETVIEPDDPIEQTAIEIVGATGRVVLIDGLTVRNARHGITAPLHPESAEIAVRNVRALNSVKFAITMAYTRSATIEYCYVEDAEYGINAGAGIGFEPTVATFRNNEVVNAKFGVSGYLADSLIEGNLVWCRTSDSGATEGVGISGQFLNTGVKDNTVTGYAKGAGMTFEWHYGRYLSRDVNVEGNTFTGNRQGVYVFPNQEELVGIAVNFNSIFDNSWRGVWNDGPTTLDATRNWWGDVSGPGRAGPGEGDRVSAKVLYSPWLGDEPGSEPMTWGMDPTSVIQEAIDGADAGDTVIVGKGRYEEELTITRSLTLRSTHGEEVTAIVGSVSIELEAGTVVFGGDESGFTVDADGGGFAIWLSINNGSELTITDNSLTGAAAGISTRDGLLHNGTAIIDYNEIYENDYGIYLESVAGGSTVLINYNGLAQNEEFGVYVESSAIVIDATNNWWGHAGGPSGDVVDPVTGATADGAGSSVSEHVNFDPWLDGPLYRIRISSTAGGSVTAPGEGDFFYTGGTVVDLSAEHERGHRFDRWTGDVGTIANAYAPTTTITVDGNYAITAWFRRGDCLIAAAAYGTETAGNIDILREFRNTVLLPNALGAELVSLYYRTSPPIAGFISQNEILRTAVRVGLVDPLAAMVDSSKGLWSAAI